MSNETEHSKRQVMLEINKIYTINGQRMRLIRKRLTGINTYQIVDENDNDLVVYCTIEPNVIKKYGIRLIRQ